MPFATTVGPETLTVTCRLALLLEDGFVREPRLAGPVVVRIDQEPAPWQKPGESTWIFFALSDGVHTVHVESNLLYPYYRGVDIPVAVPPADPRWPAYPDRSIADPALKLDDPGQPAPYRAQRALASLQPTAAYPFPPGATLVRGRVTAGGAALAGATVSVDGGTQLPYLSEANGSFVIFFEPPGQMDAPVTLRAQHPAKPDVLTPAIVRRGVTTVIDIAMAP